MPQDVVKEHSADSEDEEDFMSDAFLASLVPPTTSSKSSSQSTSYKDKRKQAQRASEARNKANAPKSFKQLREEEEERRREGLKKSLFEKEQEAGKGPSKALKMMMNMGFSVGDSLGKQSSEQIIGSGSAASSIKPENTLNKSGAASEVIDAGQEAGEEDEGFGGIGRSKRRKLESPVEPSLTSAPSTANTSNSRLEPLGIKLWAGRKGLGPQARDPPSPVKPKASDTVSPAVPLDAYAYRSRQQIEYEERKAESQLRSARKTVIELDERADRGFSILHLDPAYLPSFPPPLLEHLTAPPSTADEDGSVDVGADLGIKPSDESNLAEAERLRKQMQADALNPLNESDWTDGAGEDDKAVRAADGPHPGRLERETDGQTEEDQEDWAVLAGEARKYIVLPAAQRLSLTRDYLRSEFQFCIFCGFAYDSADQMERECPGLTEEDHD